MTLNPTRKYYLLLLALAITYDTLFTLPPILPHYGVNPDLIYRFFQPVCHQMDARSFHLFGYKLAVCSRCSSIYYGFTLGIILYPLFKSLGSTQTPGLTFFVIALTTLIADFSLNYFTPFHNTFLSRSITGGALGISGAFLFVPIWISLMMELSAAGNSAKTRGVPQNEK